jgi:hypothetical protein
MKGGKDRKEIFFIPPSNQITIPVIIGNKKDVLLYVYTPTVATLKAKKKNAKFSREYTLLNLFTCSGRTS